MKIQFHMPAGRLICISLASKKKSSFLKKGMKYLSRYFANRFWCNINTEPIASDKEQLVVSTFYQNFFTHSSSFILDTDSLSKFRFANPGVTQASHLGAQLCCPLRIRVNSVLPFLRNCHALAGLWSNHLQLVLLFTLCRSMGQQEREAGTQKENKASF